MTITSTRLAVDPLTATIGAEVSGVNLSEPLSPEVVGDIRNALHQYQVLFFHGAHLDIDQQIAFARHFGEINPAHPAPGTAVEGRREIYSPATFVPGGEDPIWHSDHSYMRYPSAISVLRAVKLPEFGGDTQWASMVAAYDRLSDPLKKIVDRLVAVHVPSPHFHKLIAKNGPGTWNGKPVTEIPPAEHPVVRVDKETGRKSLYINPGGGGILYIKGLARHESSALLALLKEHITLPEHVVRFRWQVGSVAMWDNQTTLHYPVADYLHADDRYVERVSLYGTEILGSPDVTLWS